MTAPLDLAAVKARVEGLRDPFSISADTARALVAEVERLAAENARLRFMLEPQQESDAVVLGLSIARDRRIKELYDENARLRADNENANLAASVSRKAFACSASEAVRFVAEHFGDCIQWHELGRRRKAAIRRWVLAYADRIAPKASIDAAQGGR